MNKIVLPITIGRFVLDKYAYTFRVPSAQQDAIVFDIQLGVPVLTAGFSQMQKIVLPVKALVDTGATGSCVSRRFADSVQLTPFKKTSVRSAQGIFPASVYLLDVIFPNGLLIQDSAVTEFLGEDEFDFIIGMNILRLGDTAITNAENETQFSFRVPPGLQHIDFTQTSAP
jgi:predicted aspartyl protease